MSNDIHSPAGSGWKSAVANRIVPPLRDKLLALAKAHLNKRVKKFIFKRGPKWMSAAKEGRVQDSPFFKLYPYEGPIRMKSVDAHSVVDFELGIFFHRIPKCANSSLTASIEQLREGKTLAADQGFRRALKKSHLRPADLTPEDLQKIPLLRKFVFVRNPYSRVLSAYRSKVLAPWATDQQIRIDVNSKPDVTEPPTFPEFCKFLHSEGLYRNHHWYPQVDYLVFHPRDYDFIGRIETIDADFKRLAALITAKEPSVEMLPEDPAHRTGSTDAMANYYTPELCDLVYETYKRDFEAFGYQRM